jgi:hypothetical protein
VSDGGSWINAAWFLRFTIADGTFLATAARALVLALYEIIDFTYLLNPLLF